MLWMFFQYGTTPLVWAARKGHLECVKYLLQMGADVDQEGAVSNCAFSSDKYMCILLFFNFCYTNTEKYMKQDEMLVLECIAFQLFADCM